MRISFGVFNQGRVEACAKCARAQEPPKVKGPRGLENNKKIEFRNSNVRVQALQKC